MPSEILGVQRLALTEHHCEKQWTEGIGGDDYRWCQEFETLMESQRKCFCFLLPEYILCFYILVPLTEIFPHLGHVLIEK
jgi:hypothetical protein